MQNSYKYTKKVRSSKINQQNIQLHMKFYQGRNTLQVSLGSRELNSSRDSKNQEKISEPDKALNPLKANQKKEKKQAIRSYRQSPLNKTINIERERENLRLGIKIFKQAPSINIKKLEKIHEQAHKYKQRIMRYRDTSLKSQKYLKNRLQSSKTFGNQSAVKFKPENIKNQTSHHFLKEKTRQKSPRLNRETFVLTEYQG